VTAKRVARRHADPKNANDHGTTPFLRVHPAQRGQSVVVPVMELLSIDIAVRVHMVMKLWFSRGGDGKRFPGSEDTEEDRQDNGQGHHKARKREWRNQSEG
jgi:hypothetical protein